MVAKVIIGGVDQQLDHVTYNTLPDVPWQLTGNHWLAIPCIHPADGSVHALGVVHRGARAAVEFAGGADFVNGRAPALLKPIVEIDGRVYDLSAGTMAWERALEWLPTFTCTLGDVVVRGTVFACTYMPRAVASREPPFSR